MERVGLVNPDSADGEVAEMFAKVKARIGRVNNMSQVMANSPAVLKGYIGLQSALAGGALSKQAAERIALAVSQANECGLCLAAHTALGGKAGLSEGEIVAARRGTSAEADQAALVRFAVRLVETRGTVTDEDVHEVRAAGFGDAEILEVVAHTALSVLTNYVNKVAGTPVDFPAAPALD